MTTYTIINSDGEMLETGLTLRDAAAEVVSHGRFAGHCEANTDEQYAETRAG